MIEILERWNRWGRAILVPGLTREITETLIKYLDTPEIIALLGPRRAGKTTVLYQLIHHLEKHQHVDPRAILHINFEEPSLAPTLTLKMMDTLYDEYRAHIYPEGKAYLFLDEIQNIPEWERWVRARNESENIKIFITGSSAKLFSRELGTLLTGRHLVFSVFPLNFREYLQFRNVPLPHQTALISPPKTIQHQLLQFMQWGSFPAVILAQDDEQREELLRRYFDDILYKDVALRHSIRDLNTLRNFAAHLLTQTGSLLSFTRLGNLFGISTELASHYCHYLQESYLITLLPFYSLKVSERNRNPQKIHVIDPGIRRIASLSGSKDFGHLIESMVYNKLRQVKNDGIFYWKKTGEMDFVLRRSNKIEQVIQVAYSGLDDPSICNREINACIEAKKQFPSAKASLICWEMPTNKKIFQNAEIALIPLWQFLLAE
jgi:predicted AAA+ superfamily ATPase